MRLSGWSPRCLGTEVRATFLWKAGAGQASSLQLGTIRCTLLSASISSRLLPLQMIVLARSEQHAWFGGAPPLWEAPEEPLPESNSAWDCLLSFCMRPRCTTVAGALPKSLPVLIAETMHPTATVAGMRGSAAASLCGRPPGRQLRQAACSTLPACAPGAGSLAACDGGLQDGGAFIPV